MKMASSQVEIVSSSTLICGQKDRNRQEICRDNNNVRGTQTVLENNLKVLVRDHLSNSPKPADSGNNSKNQAKNRDNKNESERIEDSDSRSKGRVLDRRPGKTGETNKKQDSKNKDSMNLNGDSNSKKSSNPENQGMFNPSEEETRSRNEKSPASSLVLMWEARLQQPIANPNQNSNNRTNVGTSVSETPSLDSSNAEISTIEEKDENNNNSSGSNTENQINNGDETDWDSQSDMNSVSDTTEKERVNSVSGSADEERVKIFDIIRRLSSDPDQANSSTGSVPEQAVVQSTPRIRGRQAFADLLLQMERSRQKELLSISERHVVSKFPHRGRLQSMLKIRCMQRCVAIQGRNRPKSAAPDSSRSGSLRPREKPKTGMENSGDGRKETTNSKNLEDSRTFQNNGNSGKNGEIKFLAAQETKGGSLLPPQDTTVKTAEKTVPGKMQKASTTEIDEKNVPRNFSEQANSRKIAENSKSDSREDGKRAASGQHGERIVFREKGEKASSREIDENLFLRKNLEKCGLLEAAVKTAGRENVEKAVLKDVGKDIPGETREKKIFRENADKVDSGRATEKIVVKQTGEITISRKIAEKNDSRQTTEKSIGRETAEKITAREATEKGKAIEETTKKNDSCQNAEKMNFRKAADRTNSRETAEKTNLRETAEKSNSPDAAAKTVALETPEKAANKSNSRETAEKTKLGENAEKTNFRDAAEKKAALETSEKESTREIWEKSNSREIARGNVFNQADEKPIAKEIVKKKGETQNGEKTNFDENSTRSLNETQKSHTETAPCKDSSEKETTKMEKKIANETAGMEEEDKRKIAETSNSRNPSEKSKIQERLEGNGRLEESKSLSDSGQDRFLDGEEVDLMKGWGENEEEEEEEEEEDLEDYSDDPSFCAEIGYDWFSDISRPKSYWEDLRKQWYLEVLNTDSEKHEIRQLLQRQSVSNFLSSDLKDKIDRLIISRTKRQENTDQKQGGDERWEEIETDQEQGSEIARVVTNANAECHEASSDRLSQSSSSLMSGTSLMKSWSYYDQVVADDRDQDASASPAAQSARSTFPANHTEPVTMEMQLICDLRSQMEQLQREVSELKNSMKSCIETQLNLQKSISHDTHSGGGSESMLGRKCCVCRETPVDSLLYRCGHMCTCLKCANELQWSSGKCPKCFAPIVDVVRVFL